MNSDHFSRQVPVPSFQQATPNDATPNDSATGYGSIEPGVTAPPIQPDAVSTPPERVYTPLLPDLSKYDLTVGEALEVFPAQSRKMPSIRTLQRYCQEGRFDCFKLKTTRNGNPVHEWIINSTSLRSFVHTKPEEIISAPMAPPDGNGDAEPVSKTATSVDAITNVTTPPEHVDDANDNPGLPRTPEANPNVMATLVTADDASEKKQSRVALMVENAKLTAQLDSQEDLIGELREDKKFMREQIVHQRGNDTLMADMHRETLHTLKAVSVAGRHTKIEMPDPSTSEQGSDYYDVKESEHRPQNRAVDDV
jgi:hypothetical protein